MKYEVFGGSFPAAKVTLNAEESVVTQSGALAWSDTSVQMDTNMKGGFLKSLGRMFSGTSLMFVTHKATQDGSSVTFSSSFPGSIRAFEVDGAHEYIAQKSAFLVADPGVNVDATFNKKFWASVFGGEGFIMQKFTGEGTMLAEIDGSVEELELAAGESIKVETGHIAVFEATVGYNIERVRGFKNIFFGGQGLFLTTLTGPGRVWLQTLTAQDMAQRLIPYLPKSTTTVNTSSSHSSSSSSN